MRIKRRNKKNKFLICMGLLLIAAALILTLYNQFLQIRGDMSARAAAEEISAEIDKLEIEGGGIKNNGVDDVPLYEKYPDMEMPVISVDGVKYIGEVSIPKLELELPVQKEWDYNALNKSPCRYKGSVYKDNMIIAGHNFKRHFGRLKDLTIGDFIIFTDGEGNVFNYTVAELEQVPGTAIADMEAGDWDLTLFTCTLSGTDRVTVRCVREE